MSAVYYKATRPDGTAFHCSKTLYVVGRTVRPKRSKRREICGPGYLHASDVPTETLIGGQWPCRLFEVTGKPRVGFDDRHPHKGGFRQLKVVKELPAWKVFGPRGEEIVAHVERCKKLTAVEARELRAAWGAAGDAARGAAWGAAWGAAGDAARGAAWGAAGDAARGAAWGAAWGAAGDAARGAAWGAAGDAARGAALAILTRDLIGTGNYTQEHHDLLYGPWKKVVG